MSVILKAVRGASMAEDLQAYDRTGAPMVGIFLDTDVTSGLIFPASSSPATALAITPTVTWLVPDGAANGKFRVALTPTNTLALSAGSYWVDGEAAGGMEEAELIRAQLTVYDSASTSTPPV